MRDNHSGVARAAGRLISRPLGVPWSAQFMSELVSADALESQAYREAGHVLMAYLITRAGIADHFFALPIQPVDRGFLVPEFDLITMNGDLSELARPSPSLRSLTTMPLFLLGGVAAQRIREATPKELPLPPSPAVSRAMGMLASYFEEYGAIDAQAIFDGVGLAIRDFYRFTERELRNQWPALETLSLRLQEKGFLSRHDAFALLDNCIPEENQKPSSRIAREEA